MRIRIKENYWTESKIKFLTDLFDISTLASIAIIIMQILK